MTTQRESHRLRVVAFGDGKVVAIRARPLAGSRRSRARQVPSIWSSSSSQEAGQVGRLLDGINEFPIEDANSLTL